MTGIFWFVGAVMVLFGLAHYLTDPDDFRRAPGDAWRLILDAPIYVEYLLYKIVPLPYQEPYSFTEFREEYLARLRNEGETVTLGMFKIPVERFKK